MVVWVPPPHVAASLMHGNAWNKQVMISESRQSGLRREVGASGGSFSCGPFISLIPESDSRTPFPSIEHRKSSIYGATGLVVEALVPSA